MLKPGGQLGFTVVTKAEHFFYIQSLGKDPKWKNYMTVKLDTLSTLFPSRIRIMFNGSSPVILFIYNFQRDMSSSYQHGMRMGKMPKNASKMLSLKLVSRLLISRHIKETIFTTLEP